VLYGCDTINIDLMHSYCSFDIGNTVFRPYPTPSVASGSSMPVTMTFGSGEGHTWKWAKLRGALNPMKI